MNRSTPGLPVHHKLPEFTQTHAHRVGDAIQPSHHRLILMCSFYMTSFTYSKFYLFLIKTKCKNLYYHFLMLLFLSTILFGWSEEPQWTSLVAQMVKESACNVGDLGLIPGLGKILGGGHDNPLQYSCLENPHRQRSLAGYRPRGHKESDTTE